MNIRDILGGGASVNVQNMNVFVMGDGRAERPPVVNPGIEYGKDGKAKYSPPLQQQLSVMKDAVGVTTDDVTVEPTEQEVEALAPENDLDLDRIRQLAAIFTPAMQFPSG